MVTLYHYTTPAALLNILESRQIWTTDIKFFNDSKELYYVYDVADRLLDQRMEAAEGNELDEVRKLAESIRFQKSVARLQGPYVTSFSANGDQLSQWRGYAGAAGYALGFEVVPPKAVFTPPEVELVPCEYGEENLSAAINETVDRILRGDVGTDFAPLGLEAFLETVLATFAPRHKHESFQEEAEWRLIVREGFVSNELDMSFREGGSTIIPYYAIPFSYNSHQLLRLAEVVIGPTADKKLAEAALTDVLIQTDHDESRIRFSKVPFRHV